MSACDADHDRLLDLARAGDDAARGRLLERYRNFLHLLVRSMAGGVLRAEVDASDLVQETFLRAHRDLGQFRGTGEPELSAWLRRILAHQMIDQLRHQHRLRRDVGRQISVEALLDRSSPLAGQALTAALSSPSTHVTRREQAVLVADALARLPSDYREVVVLRIFEQQPLAAIAARMGRSEEACRKLWKRALAALHHSLESQP